MFKHLKKKLEQGVAQSKAVVSGFTRGDDSSENNTSSDSLGQPVAVSTPQKDVNQIRPVVEDFSSPVSTGSRKSKGALTVRSRQLDESLFEGPNSAHYETASDVSSFQGDDIPKDNRSRTSSVSSMASESTYFPSVNLSHGYPVPSDAESEMEETSLNLSSVSKEDLYAFVKRFEQRAFKYKTKFMEIAAAYKDMLQEKDMLKTTLIQNQDGASRRISELKEQIHLGQLAKQDLEENYRLLLEENDEYTKILQMQVKLLKEGRDIPEELESKLVSKKVKVEDVSPIIDVVSKDNSSADEEMLELKSKIKRQDGLLQKCKDTITNYKDKVSQLSQEKQELLGKLELISKGGDRAHTHTPDQLSRLQAQIQEARKIIEQLESDKEVAIAEVKQQVHEEMEKKDVELEQVKGQHQKFLAENNSLKLEIERLTNETEDLRRLNQEQLEKARNIIRKLKEDNKLALEQAEARIRHAEQSMEEEKEKMLSDLKRGKAEAFSVMQHESEKNLAEKVEAAVEERDKFWNKKMAAHAETHKEMLRLKDREKEMAVATMQEEVRHKLKEKEEEVRLALEERELQKMAAVTGLDEQKDRLLVQIEELSSEKIELSNRFSKFQEDSEHQILKLKEELNHKETEHRRVINELLVSHEEVLMSEKSKLVQKVTEEVELMKQRHTEEIQNLIDKHEQDLQESNSELENYYRAQMELEKEKLENLLIMTKDQLEEMKNSFSLNQTKLTETEKLLAETQAELESIKKEQGRFDVRKSTDIVEQPFLDGKGLIQKDQVLADEENSIDIQNKMVEGSNSEFRTKCDMLSEELESVKEELAAAKNELSAFKTEKFQAAEKFQQSSQQTENEREESNSQIVQELREQIIKLNEEHECLNRNIENSRFRIEELEKSLEETVNVKTAAESKAQDFENQVGQLQEVIRTLESCQNTVEKEKASLEQKLTFLENIVGDLKASKEELNEKLHGRHEALIQRSAEEKDMLVLKANEFASQVDILKEEINALNQELLSKTDENIALRSVVDDNAGFVKSLETRIEKLTTELHIKSQTNSQNEAALAKSLDKFERLKNEANTKVKGLKEMKDSLTEQVNEKQKEIEEIRSTFTLEKDAVVKKYEDRLSKQEEEMRALEQSFKEQFDQKQAKFKEIIIKLKEQHENSLKEKERHIEDLTQELISNKGVGTEDLTKNFEHLREQLKKQELKHQTVVDDITTEWETKIQQLMESHNQELEAISSQYQQQISELQQKLSDKDSLIQELNSSIDQFASVQKELEDIKLEMEMMSEKQRVVAESMNIQLEEKDSQIQHLTVSLESLNKQSSDEFQQKESLLSQINLLTEQLHEKDTKLESMAGTISAEQEYLHKQLDQQTEIAQELQAQKNALASELKETVEVYDAQLKEKDTLLKDVIQKSALLEMEHASLREMLRTDSDTSEEKDISTRSLQEHLQHFNAEKDSKIHDLETHLETESSRVIVLQEELQSLRDQHEQLTQNHSKEIDIIKSDYDSQISCLSSSEIELQTEAQTLKSQLTEANEKLQECIQSYESKLEDERSKLEIQEDSFKEQINVLKQQLHEIQSQKVVSSNELQSSLHQNVKESEAKLQCQLQLHQKEIDIVKQEAENKMKDLKQKYVAKLKEIQSHAKVTIEELENTLQNEKAAKSEMCVELSRANTRLLQLEENSGTSRDTIIDLEHKVVDMTALLKSKDSELAMLQANMTSNEKNMQEILEEAEANSRQINDKLIQSEIKLKQNESDLHGLNDQLQVKIALLEQKETIIRDFESRCSQIEKTCIQEKENYEHELKEKNEKCIQLEALLKKTQNELEMTQSKFAELDCKVLTTSSSLAELEGIQTKLQAEIVQLSAEKEELKSKLFETEAAFEMSLKEHASLVTEMENRISDSEFQKEQIKLDYETRLNQLQQTNTDELSALSVSVETQISSKVAEYKKKAEAYISQVKKQLQDEHTVLLDKQQENITKLEETVTILTQEINNLKQSKENLIAENENIIQNMKSQVEEEITLKQSLIEEYDQKEKEFHHSELSLKKQIESLLLERNLLLEQLSVIEKEFDNWKAQQITDIEELKSKNDELLKINLESLNSGKSEEDLAALKTELEVLQKLQNSSQATLEEQANEHASKMEQLVKETNLQMAEKEKEIENIFKEAIEKSEQDRECLIQEHRKVQDELREEIMERDKQIQELHVEYQAKIQEAVQQNQTPLSVFQRGAAEDSMLQEQVTLLTREIEQIRRQHKQEIAEIQSIVDMGHNSLPQPLVAAPSRLNMDALDPNFSAEMQNLELHNMDLQAQVSQLYSELSLYKIKERDLLRKVDKPEHMGKSMSDDDDPPLSLDGSFMNHTDSAIFREPTEFEYLKNILYEYMMGRETKTLARVIATVVRFSDEQMRNILTKEDTKLNWKS